MLSLSIFGSYEQSPSSTVLGSGDCLRTGLEACWQVDTFQGISQVLSHRKTT